jgi:regulator of sirC expression with transglutaminase-like and TPR domain
MDLDTALTLLADNPVAPLDLAELALHLARDEYPRLDVEGYLAELDAMAHELRPQLRGSLPTRVRRLARYLFHDLGFRGNSQDYYDPRNSYLNDVMDRRLGLPIALSVLAMAVGGRAGLQITGVGLPGHFVAKAAAAGEEVLFDPFHGGRLLTPADCEALVRQQSGAEFEASAAHLASAPLAGILLRMLTNLKLVYLRAEDFVRAVRVIERLRQLSPNDPLQQRDLGASLLQAGLEGRAIDPLSAYLKASPNAEDAATVERLLAQARGAVARWN